MENGGIMEDLIPARLKLVTQSPRWRDSICKYSGVYVRCNFVVQWWIF